MSSDEASELTLGDRLAAARDASFALASFKKHPRSSGSSGAYAIGAGEGVEVAEAATSTAIPSGGSGKFERRTRPGTSIKPRARKDEPRLISSKRPVAFGRTRCLGIEEQGPVGVGRSFDPRFEGHCGELHEEHVERNFEFLEGLREKERAELRKDLQNRPADSQLRSKLRKMEADEARKKAELRRRNIREELKAEEKKKVKEGKRPYFFKESDVREREFQAKFADLKARGGVQKYIEKRRKRHASKDRKHLLPRRDTE